LNYARLYVKPVKVFRAVKVHLSFMPRNAPLQVSCLYYYFITSVTCPAPTVLPPSRIAKRRPLSIATGTIK